MPMPHDPDNARRASPARRFVLAACAVAALTAMGLALVAAARVRDERSARVAAVHRLHSRLARADADVSTLQAQVAALQSENVRLARRIAAPRTNADPGAAPLAARILRSVFTVETPAGFGTGWAAWRAGGVTYLITADHVAEDAIAIGTHRVTVRKGTRSWAGAITATDAVNDLAVIRVPDLDVPALWQKLDTRR